MRTNFRRICGAFLLSWGHGEEEGAQPPGIFQPGHLLSLCACQMQGGDPGWHRKMLNKGLVGFQVEMTYFVMSLKLLDLPRAW